jgi:hypothetical protein
MVHFAYRNWAKNLVVDEDDEKTLHHWIEMTAKRNSKVEIHAFIEKKFTQSGAKLSDNFVGNERPRNDNVRFAQLTDGGTSPP